MSKTQNKYSKEFKVETVELARTSGKSDSQLERELGLSRGSLYAWRQQLQEAGVLGVSRSGYYAWLILAPTR